MTLIDPATLPYRPCVGIVVLNAEGLIWLGRRIGELVEQERTYRWQMPQGGIDEGEDPRTAAFRELYEETGIRNVEVLAETKEWIPYELPAEFVGVALRGKYRGQRQKWFAMRFTGAEQEIDLAPAGHKPEFDSWRWAPPKDVAESVVPFKRASYDAVLAEFNHLVQC
jgi:putative (di)nucleoside polyphosphate hydrolase